MSSRSFFFIVEQQLLAKGRKYVVKHTKRRFSIKKNRKTLVYIKKKDVILHRISKTSMISVLKHTTHRRHMIKKNVVGVVCTV